ncbi:MAG: hypothetical protein R3D29_14870 [Nitratireductor sp.]
MFHAPGMLQQQSRIKTCIFDTGIQQLPTPVLEDCTPVRLHASSPISAGLAVGLCREGIRTIRPAASPSMEFV